MNMFMRQPPPEKGDINKLWNLLGVRFDDQSIIWQDYNPYPKASQFPREFVFVDDGSGAKEPFNPKDPISAGLQQVLFLFPGSVAKLNSRSRSEVHPAGDHRREDRHGGCTATCCRCRPYGPRGGLNPEPAVDSHQSSRTCWPPTSRAR